MFESGKRQTSKLNKMIGNDSIIEKLKCHDTIIQWS
jgi:hypothetical protein